MSDLSNDERLAAILGDGFTKAQLSSPFGFDFELTFTCEVCGCLVRLPELHRTGCASEKKKENPPKSGAAGRDD